MSEHADPRIEAVADLLFWTSPWEIDGYRPPVSIEAARKLATACVAEADAAASATGTTNA